MTASEFRFGFRILGKTCEARRLVDAGAAFAAYASSNERAEVHREAYLSAFQFGEDFRRLLLETGSTAGFSGPCWSPWLWWDIDAEELHHAHQDTGALAAFLVERYNVEPGELLIFFSGSKGFHVGLCTGLWSPAPSAEFHRIARRFAENLATAAAVAIDVGVYDKVRAFRSPNSRHPKSGLHKRRLTFDELLEPLAAILELAKTPAPFDVPTVTKTSDQAAADVFDGWKDDVLTGSPPSFYPIGTGELKRIELGPGLVTLLGGAPGAGKTAFAMQAVTDALRLTPTLRVLVCNCEMPAAVLLDRQLSRLSGVDAKTVRYRRFAAEHADRLDQAMHTLEPLAERLAFVRPPFDLENVAASADAFRADLLLLDYIQRIPPPGNHADKRGSVNATMDYLRQFADAGVAVLVVAAVGRTKDAKGRTSYSGDGLNLASFRESSELEFGADDAFILVPDEGRESDTVTLRHLKARHTEAADVVLTFDRQHQSFTAQVDNPPQWKPPEQPGKLQSALGQLWQRTPPADDDADDRGDGGGYYHDGF